MIEKSTYLQKFHKTAKGAALGSVLAIALNSPAAADQVAHNFAAITDHSATTLFTQQPNNVIAEELRWDQQSQFLEEVYEDLLAMDEHLTRAIRSYDDLRTEIEVALSDASEADDREHLAIIVELSQKWLKDMTPELLGLATPDVEPDASADASSSADLPELESEMLYRAIEVVEDRIASSTTMLLEIREQFGIAQRVSASPSTSFDEAVVAMERFTSLMDEFVAAEADDTNEVSNNLAGRRL